MKILGVDLGTSNTYVYVADAPDVSAGAFYPKTPKPLVIPGVSDDTGSVATAVLYENEKPALVGNVAQSEFYVNIEEKPKRRLATQFKPEIAAGERKAMTAMTDFLRLLRDSFPEAILAAPFRVYAGVPSLSREDYAVNLGECFASAGWPKPFFARESDAALVSCLQSGVISVRDLDGQALILDFGGGTYDFTRVESADAIQTGGDILYGGRLFDDLIYQVFCRRDKEFAADAPKSPYAWYVHWVECKRQKEIFSDFLRANPDGATTLRVVWYDANEKRRESYVADYNRDAFVRDAENYVASPEILEILAPYQNRGGLGEWARDLLAGRAVGLISRFRAILETAEGRASILAAALTGGSSRWFFVEEIAKSVFPGAKVAQSRRGFEDIAFGLALFPYLEAASRHAKALLDKNLDAFAARSVALAQELVEKQIAEIANLCADRVAKLDVLPALEAAQKTGATAESLERQFSENIKNDYGLAQIVREKSVRLSERLQNELDLAFRRWLKENGVFLAPKFEFPDAVISENFFDDVSVKISRLDTLNLMKFTLEKIIPPLAGLTTAGVIAHAGEPVSAAVGGGLAAGATWLLAKTAPSFLARRKLPAFLLNDRNRRKIVTKNKEFIEKKLVASLAETRKNLKGDIETALRRSLVAMIGKLTVLNQIRVN